jgi:hypothetical protein
VSGPRPISLGVLPVNERQLLRQVVDWAKTTGWLIYHTHRSDFSPAGFPDLCLIRPPRVVFAELKSDKGRLSEQQHTWLETLEACPGVETYLWRPGDLETLVRVLR